MGLRVSCPRRLCGAEEGRAAPQPILGVAVWAARQTEAEPLGLTCPKLAAPVCFPHRGATVPPSPSAGRLRHCGRREPARGICEGEGCWRHLEAGGHSLGGQSADGDCSAEFCLPGEGRASERAEFWREVRPRRPGPHPIQRGP